MIVTIVSDASFCPKSGAAGYGVWIASNRGKKAFGNQFRHKMTSSNEAEVCAIVNAICFALKTRYLIASDTLVIDTDCRAAIQLLNRRRKSSTKREQTALEIYTSLVTKYNLTVYMKHVKAHTKSKDNRSLSNGYCDETAKANMRLARKALQGW